MKKEVKTQKMTIDKLAIMMNNSFERLEEKMATKEDLKNLESRMEAKMATKTDVERINKRIDYFRKNSCY